MIAINDKAPDFKLQSDSGDEYQLSDTVLDGEQAG